MSPMSMSNAMSATILFATFAWLSLTTGGNSECALPNMKKPINWNMLPGPWYISMSSSFPMEEAKTCYRYVNFVEIPGDGTYAQLQDIRSVSRSGEPNFAIIPQHWIYMGNSNTGILDPKFVALFADETRDEFNHEDKAAEDAAVEEVVDFFKIPFTFVTDYEHYIVEMHCKGGTNYIWAYTRNPNPPAEHIGMIKEALKEIGGGWDEVEIHPSPCTRMNIRNPIVNWK